MPRTDADGKVVLSADERAYIDLVAAQQKVAHLSAAEQAQVAYELQRNGLVRAAGCCGKREVTERGATLLWNEFNAAIESKVAERMVQSDARREAIEARA